VIETVRQAEEGEESEEEGLPEDPDNDNVEAQALFELEVEAEAGFTEESVQKHFASAVSIYAYMSKTYIAYLFGLDVISDQPAAPFRSRLQRTQPWKRPSP